MVKGGIIQGMNTERVRSGEMVLTGQQAAETRKALLDVLNEIEESEIEVDEQDLSRRVADVFKSNGIEIKKQKKVKICSQCGAPLRGCRCEYCGTEV